MARRGENIYKRKDGRWEGRYKHEWMASYRSVYGQSYPEVKKKLNAAKQESLEQRPQRGVFIKSFTDLAKAWLNNTSTRVKESTYAQYHTKVIKHIVPQLGTFATSEITAEDLETFIKRSLATGQAPKTVADTLVITKSICKYGKISIDFNSIRIKSESKEMRVLSHNEQAQLTSFLTNTLDNTKLGVLLSLYTGLRIGEVCSLKWSDIDFQSGIAVRRTIQRIRRIDVLDGPKTKLIIDSPKSKQAVRNIPIPNVLLPLLQNIKGQDDDYIVTDTARCMEPRQMQYKFKSYLKKCGLKHANYHCTRHTFATRCVETGFEIKSLSEILGHSNVRIIRNYKLVILCVSGFRYCFN